MSATGQVAGRRSARFGRPGSTLGEPDKGVEEGSAVFGGGGQVAADRAELGVSRFRRGASPHGFLQSGRTFSHLALQ